MEAGSVRLGVDFGMSHTVAAVSVAAGEPRPLLFDGSPLLPSAVCADPTGRLVVGRDALHLALAHPDRFEPHPKRCLDERSVLLGDVEVPVERLVAAVLGRVAAEARRLGGGTPGETVVTCPAAWGPQRRQVLLAAAGSVFPAVRLVAEPVAAATHFARTAGAAFAEGSTALVYDMGAGTIDATVVRRTADGMQVLATEGRPDCGGLDVDATIVEQFGVDLAGRDAAAWARLTAPSTPADRRAGRQLWDNVRTGKEMLARASTTLIHVPLLDVDLPLGREQLDALAAPILDRTVQVARAALRSAGVEAADLAAIVLAGGSTRMPAVTTALHRAFGVVPTTVDQPELVVAEGAVWTAPPTPVTAGPAPGGAAPPTLVELGSPPGRPQPTRRRPAYRSPAAVAAAVALVLVGAGSAAALALPDRYRGGGQQVAAGPSPTPTPTPTPSATPTASPTPSLKAGLDPCLIGTWKRRSSQRTGFVDGDTIYLEGGIGMTFTFRPDGTVATTYTAEPPGVAIHKGDRWEERIWGTATLSWRITDDGKILYSNPVARGKWRFTRNGKYSNGGDLTMSLKPETYVCDGDVLVQTAEYYSAESVRVSK